ncbi:M14-type cytosolic carboxypeptidase [Lederbergia ruris]|uniref:M14-type cytosolic carboxypeptidase n=1 Tax=Lederbergia ruris TaxID=217495 RepID=UPI0039A13F6F
MALRVLTDFPGGNGQLLNSKQWDDGVEIEFSAECKRGEPQALWFHFRVEGAQGSRIRCVLSNVSQCFGSIGDWDRNAPVYQVKGGKWKRVTSVKIRENEHLIPEVIFDIETVDPQVEVAFCYPYQTKDLEETLKDQDIWKQAVIGLSQQNHPITRLYNDLGDEHQPKQGIYLLARQHSGETPGSFVLDGILQYLASDAGKRARQEFCWWIVPFSDVDGVMNGYYGKDQSPHDLNRAWQTPFPLRPEVKAIQADMSRWMRRTKPFAMIDLHAPSHEEKGIYFHIPSASENILERSIQFADQFHHALPERLRGKESYFLKKPSEYTSAYAGVNSSHYVVNEIGCMAAAMEISYQGPEDHVFYSIGDYQIIGETLVDALSCTNGFNKF